MRTGTDMEAKRPETPMGEAPLMEATGDNIVLFHPHIPAAAAEMVTRVLSTRWVGQGPRVDDFEREFGARFGRGRAAIAVGSGTDALHLAYLLAGIEAHDDVIAPVFTCTATNIPLLYIGARVVFADVQLRTMNIDPADVRRRITKKTKAIVCVHYGGLPCDMAELQAIADEFGLTIIEDAAHALGASYRGRLIGEISDFTMYSFQAIKHITTGDGGMLVIKDPALVDRGKRIRWFGIDRKAKREGIWANDIREVGYKYQMTDIGAALGLSGLVEFDAILFHRQQLLNEYIEGLRGVPGLTVVGTDVTDRVHAAWLCTVLVDDRDGLRAKLREHGIESAQVHYRNDRYSIFGGRRDDCPSMDALEDRYLVLPLHTKIRQEHVRRVCDVIKSGW